MLFVYPSDYFEHNKPDLIFEEEHNAACKIAGQDNVICINFDSFLEDKDPFIKSFDISTTAVWRGWQMSVDSYVRFFDYAANHNIHLITDPKKYEQNHLLVHSFARIKQYMAATTFIDGNVFEINDVRKAINKVSHAGKVFVKDYVKGKRDSACILDKNMSNDEVLAELDSLVKDRGNDYAGGIAIRAFTPVVGETRFMVVNGKIAAFGSHFSDAAEVTPHDLKDLDLRAAGGNSLFYSLDVALTEDTKELCIIETGDGQVSECPEGQERNLIEALMELG